MGGGGPAGAGAEVERLLVVLEGAREKGFLGPGDPLSHLRHAEGLARIIEAALGSGDGPGEFCDLGSGGGVPGLVMLCRWPGARCTLIEVGRRRCEALREALEVLGLCDRADVVEGRAEDVAREPDRREAFPVVVARSFGRPAVTAEVAAGLVAPGGVLVVSEPPDGGEAGRWPPSGLAMLGFGPARIAAAGGATAAVVEKQRCTDDRWPRRVGVPAKRPLW